MVSLDGDVAFPMTKVRKMALRQFSSIFLPRKDMILSSHAHIATLSFSLSSIKSTIVTIKHLFKMLMIITTTLKLFIAV